MVFRKDGFSLQKPPLLAPAKTWKDELQSGDNRQKECFGVESASPPFHLSSFGLQSHQYVAKDFSTFPWVACTQMLIAVHISMMLYILSLCSFNAGSHQLLLCPAPSHVD